MNYEIKCGSFPIVECTLNNGENIVTESGIMSWMDDTILMETTFGGGILKSLGRLTQKESLLQCIYKSTKDGSKITFGTSAPGAIIAVPISQGQSIICQKRAFLAGYGEIDLSIHFNKKIGVGIFGGEGFIMEKITGNGTVFLEIDGSAVQYDLQPEQKIIVSTGYLVSMSETCKMDVQTIPGLKNAFLGGEGLFNTIITGPGRVILQTMPLSKLASSLLYYMPSRGDNSIQDSVMDMLVNK